MANSKSALKRVRQNEKRREAHRKVRSAIRTFTNRFDAAIDGGKKKDAAEAYRQVVSVLDRAASKRVIPKQRADRKKGRMATRLAAL